MGQFYAFDNNLNLNVMIREHGKVEVEKFLKALTEQEAQMLYEDPYFTLRENQIIPQDGRFGTMILSGRGWGKTFCGSAWVNQRAYEGKGPILIVGQTASDVNDTMVEKNPSSIIEVAPDWFKPEYYPSKRLLVWPNGTLGFLRSGDTVEQLRGQNSQTVWLDELAKWEKLDEAWSNIVFGLRQGDDPQYLITTTPRSKPLIKKLYNSPDCVVISGSTFDNAANLNERALEEMRKAYEGTTLGEQELHGKIIWQDDNALWKRDQIDAFRCKRPDNILEFTIGLDPTTGGGKRRNDEAGIIVACSAMIDGDKHAFVLADYTVAGTPQVWATAVKEALDAYPKATIIAESNQGGNMITQVLSNAGVPAWRVKLKHHMKSKYDRAQPVSLKAEQGYLHHCGTFDKLEDELTSFTGESGEKSPNRLDALVLAVDPLIIDNRPGLKIDRMGI
ncbi:MAG: putative terminase [Prokaryotic dsDNA virus sp.]|nr:MAG: putative terminase [Prokaryotic dsDNA virus sp.]